MPCDQRIELTIGFRDADPTVLKAALIRAGYQVNEYGDTLTFYNAEEGGRFQNGSFKVREGFDIGPIKAAYATEAVERATKKYGWSLKKTQANSKVTKYVAMRRSY